VSEGSVRRYVALALWAGILLAPSVAVAAGLLAAGVAAALGPALWRAVRGRPRLSEGDRDGGRIMLGTDRRGRPVTLDGRQLAAHSLIVGAAGAGKSTTMLAILDAQIQLGQPVIAIDMKGSPAFAEQLRASAAAAGRGLRVWTPEGPGHWNPLAHGNATSLKDKLIASERFSEPHFQRAAERYLQIVLGVLQEARPDRPPQLHEVAALMEPVRLAVLLRRVPGARAEQVQDYLAALTGDQRSGIAGVGTRLAVLGESCAGPYLRAGPSEATIDVQAGLEGGDVILFSLNSSVYGKLAAQLGGLAVQDVISATGARLGSLAGTDRAPAPATVAIDEFSALDNDNVLGLLARGREFGVRAMIATQEIADLERAGRGFADQVLGIVGVKIIHRQDVPASAEMVARMSGTERYWEETRQIGGLFSGARGRGGTRRPAERYVVHPNVVMRLRPGQAILMTKLPEPRVQWVAVRPPPRRPPAAAPATLPPPSPQPLPPTPTPRAERPPGRRRPSSRSPERPPARQRPPYRSPERQPERAPGRDYPAPGVTR
jgi:conjugal transfer pilus assembly protein TraD